MPYPLPHDTQIVVEDEWQNCRNIGLLFDRFTFYQSSNWQLEGGEKQAILQAIEELARQAMQDGDERSQDYRALIEAMQARQMAQVAGIKSADCEAWRQQVALENRLIVGLGRKAALEVGFGTHWLYGVPTIPGSALKGLARAWAFWELATQFGIQPEPYQECKKRQEDDKRYKTQAEKLDELLSTPIGAENSEARGQWLRKRGGLLPDEALAKVQEFQAVFGTQEASGGVVFFDAIPAQPPQIRVDVMNPHFGDYYQEKDDRHGHPVPPADYLSPVPVYFLTVEQTPFSFALAARTPQAAGLVEPAKGWLVKALTELGAGGKTSAGYGYFADSSPAPVAPQSAKRAPLTEPAVAQPAAPLEWKPARVKKPPRGQAREIIPNDDPDHPLRFRPENVHPKGWMPPAKAHVEYAICIEPDGKRTVLVRKPRLRAST
jgi:CRISPR-associated protein Cmr6